MCDGWVNEWKGGKREKRRERRIGYGKRGEKFSKRERVKKAVAIRM